MEISKTSANSYIASLDEDTAHILAQVDDVIVKAMPKGTQKLLWQGKFWGGTEQHIIGYGLTHYVRSDKKEGDWFIVGLAAQKNYFSVFVSALKGQEPLVEQYKSKLGKVKTTKSALNFKKLEDLDLQGLAELVSAAFRVSDTKR